LVQLIVGVTLFGVGLAVFARVRSKTRTWTRAQRVRLGVLPALLGAIFYVIAFASAGLGAIWVVPTGFAGLALIQLAALRVTERRIGSQGLAG
jgi:hypothetical protein